MYFVLRRYIDRCFTKCNGAPMLLAAGRQASQSKQIALAARDARGWTGTARARARARAEQPRKRPPTYSNPVGKFRSRSRCWSCSRHRRVSFDRRFARTDRHRAHRRTQSTDPTRPRAGSSICRLLVRRTAESSIPRPTPQSPVSQLADKRSRRRGCRGLAARLDVAT